MRSAYYRDAKCTLSGMPGEVGSDISPIQYNKQCGAYSTTAMQVIPTQGLSHESSRASDGGLDHHYVRRSSIVVVHLIAATSVNSSSIKIEGGGLTTRPALLKHKNEVGAPSAMARGTIHIYVGIHTQLFVVYGIQARNMAFIMLNTAAN